MSDEQALVPTAEKQVDLLSRALIPIEQREVIFHDDQIMAVLVDIEGRRQIFVPVKPICDFLGVDWPSQYRRLKRDAVLSQVIKGIVITTIPSGSSVGGGPQEMICLPLDYLNGFLFGLNASRVKKEVRDRLVLYQLECYQILARAFVERPLPVDSPTVASLTQIKEMARAIMEMAEQQIEYERRITTTESRLDRAAVVVGQIQNRLTAVERKLAPGNPITDEQAAEIQAAVHGLALLLTEQDKGKNHFQGIFNELHRRFGVTSYKLIPQGKYADVLEFLGQWQGKAGS